MTWRDTIARDIPRVSPRSPPLKRPRHIARLLLRKGPFVRS